VPTFGFTDYDTWIITHIYQTPFGNNDVNGKLTNDWSFKLPSATPRDCRSYGDQECGIPWVYPIFGAEQNPTWMDTGHPFQQPQNAYAGVRISCDIRFASVPGSGDPGAASLIAFGAMNDGYAFASLGTYFGITFSYGVPSPTWTMSSPVGTFPISPLTTNRYYRVGVAKLGTRLSVWMRMTATIDPSGRVVDHEMIKVGETTIFPLWATSGQLGFFSSAMRVSGANPDAGRIAYPYVEELSLTFQGARRPPGLPSNPINLPSGGEFALPAVPDAGGSPFSPLDLNLADYHRYKNVRSAMAIYNNIRLDQ
jgi:hypothetical protein